MGPAWASPAPTPSTVTLPFTVSMATAGPDAPHERAVLDLMRQAAATLATEANGVSDNPLIFAESREALSGGNFHAEPVAFECGGDRGVE